MGPNLKDVMAQNCGYCCSRNWNPRGNATLEYIHFPTVFALAEYHNWGGIHCGRWQCSHKRGGPHHQQGKDAPTQQAELFPLCDVFLYSAVWTSKTYFILSIKGASHLMCFIVFSRTSLMEALLIPSDFTITYSTCVCSRASAICNPTYIFSLVYANILRGTSLNQEQGGKQSLPSLSYCT